MVIYSTRRKKTRSLLQVVFNLGGTVRDFVKDKHHTLQQHSNRFIQEGKLVLDLFVHRKIRQKEHLAITMASSIEEQTKNNDYNDEDADTINRIRPNMEILNSFSVKSNFYNVGMRLRDADQHDLARDAFQRGSETGCIPCMHCYTSYLSKGGMETMIHLRLPWLLEGAIRGQPYITNELVRLYKDARPALPNSLQMYWTKILNSLHTSWGFNKERRKNNRGSIGSVCFKCSKEDSYDRKFQQCSGCKIYSYCGKECQLQHWNGGNHRGECKQLQILNTYHKPYAKQILKKIIRGDDPTEVIELQTLREKLGLSRPKDEYEKLSLFLGDDCDDYSSIRRELSLFLGDDCDDYFSIRREFIVARHDGTVHIGSTSEVI